MALAFLYGFSITGYAQQQVTLTFNNPAANGSTTIPSTATTTAAGATAGVDVTAIGGGGGGGGCGASGYNGIGVTDVAGAAGGGGGQGCTTTGILSPGGIYSGTIVVGRGGTGGTGSNQASGGNGTASSIGSVSAGGGVGAISSTRYDSGLGILGSRDGFASGAGGAGCTTSGANGDCGRANAPYAGICGGSLSSNGNSPNNIRGGTGGGSSANGGNVGSSNGTANGTAGTVPGAGGGGGSARSIVNSSWTFANGGAGANGQITVNYWLPKPVVTPSANPVCSGDDVTFTISNMETAVPVTYTLNGPDGFSQSFSSGTLTVNNITQSGTYYITVQYVITATNGTGGGSYNVQSDNINLTVTTALTPPPVITGLDEVCIDEWLSLSAQAGFSAYSWSGGSMQGLGTGNTEQFTWNTLGSKTVSLTVTDVNGCIGNTTKDIVVIPKTDTGAMYRLPNYFP